MLYIYAAIYFRSKDTRRLKEDEKGYSMQMEIKTGCQYLQYTKQTLEQRLLQETNKDIA